MELIGAFQYFSIFFGKLPKIKEKLGGCSVLKKKTHGAEELFVMVSEAKMLQPIARFASVSCLKFETGSYFP